MLQRQCSRHRLTSAFQLKHCSCPVSSHPTPGRLNPLLHFLGSVEPLLWNLRNVLPAPVERALSLTKDSNTTQESMTQTIIVFAAMALSQESGIKCPVMGSAVAQNSPTVEYKGARYNFCCGGCDTSFAKAPEEFLKTQRKAGNTVGVFLFDPVSRVRLDSNKAVANADFEGIRYPFQSEASKKAFLASPAKFVAVPAKEALYCPVGKEALPSYAKASDYVDHDGVRWYMCCDGCGGPFAKEPNKYLVGGIEKQIQAPKPIKTSEAHLGGTSAREPALKIKSGKYEAELRIPEEGLFAHEEIDVEFRVVDTTAKDPVEVGFKGVGGITATATMTMPSMEGMPAAKPEVHREGVPGDYGIVLFFPHGGEYKIDLNLEIPGGGTEKASFIVAVKDERLEGSGKAQPYRLDVVEWPAHPMAGQSINLKLKVLDTKSGHVQTAFDEAHTKRFHLLLASKDLNWFLHEHPEMAADGTWSVPITFPAGGDYWVYGDVAPSGKGARILISRVTVHGDEPKWDTKLRLNNVAEDGGLRGEIALEGGATVGKTATIMVKLFDAKTGVPVGDTVKFLGAAGHLMIIHEDGQTVVHSHPAEDARSEELVTKGIVHFTGRFSKPGRYKAYAQFDWRGAVRTLGFGIEVKK